MSNSSTPLPPAGWYRDPAGGAAPRWWNGAEWAPANTVPAGASPLPVVRPEPSAPVASTPVAPVAPIAPVAPPVPAAPIAPSMATAPVPPAVPVPPIAAATPVAPAFPAIPAAAPPVAPAAYPAANPGIPAQTVYTPMSPASTNVSGNTWQIWTIVAIPLLPLIASFFIDFEVVFYSAAYSPRFILRFLFEDPAYIATIVLGGLAYWGNVALAFADHRQLMARRIERPFHWAFAFIGALVYVIGRSLIVRKRTGRGLAPMWVLIAIQIFGFIIGMVLMMSAFSFIARLI